MEKPVNRGEEFGTNEMVNHNSWYITMLEYALNF